MLLSGNIRLPLAGLLAAIGLMGCFASSMRRRGLLLIIAAAGIADLVLSVRTVTVPKGERVYSATITATSERGSREALTVDIDSVDSKPISAFKARLYLDQELDDRLSPGMRLCFRATLQPTDTTVTLPDQMSQAEILGKSGIKATSYITSTAIISTGRAEGFTPALLKMRQRIESLIYLSSLSPSSKSFVATVLLGADDAMSDEMRDKFSRAGLSHIMALSGLHVAIIAAFIFWLLAPTVLFFPRHLRSVAMIILIWAYACLTGLNAPVVRTCIMTSLVLLADILQRRTFALNSLMAAALLILLFSPTDLFRPSFQLSFLAVGSIIAFADHLNPFDGIRNPLLRLIGGSVGMTLAAMLSTALVSILHFHTLPVLFLLSNVVVGPILMPAILIGGIIVLAASTLSLPYGFPAKIVDISVAIIDKTASFVATLPHSTVEIWSLSSTTVILFTALLAIIALYLRRGDNRSLYLSFAGILASATGISALSLNEEADRDPIGTWYHLPAHDYADILFPVADHLYLLTDAPLSTHESRAGSLRFSLSKYIGRRGIKEIIPMPDRLAVEGLVRRGNIIIAEEQTIALLTDIVPSVEADILVVTRSYRGDLISAVEQLKPKRIILSPALHPRLRSRYSHELSSLIKES